MYEVDLRRGFTHPSMISVWNEPRQTLSHTMISSSMFTSGGPPQAPSSRVSAPSGPGAFNGVIITYEVDPRRGFTHPSMISVWNEPRQTLSHTMISSSTFTSGGPPQAPSSRVSAPSGLGTTVPNWQKSSRVNLVVDHGMARLSILLSWITLISLLIVQVPMTKGTLHPKSGSSGTTRNTASSS